MARRFEPVLEVLNISRVSDLEDVAALEALRNGSDDG